MGLQETLEAIADPNRRKILNLLKEQELSVSQIGEHLDISGASLCHHLNKLKSADLVTSRRRGQTILYSIHTTVFEDMATTISGLFKSKRKS